MAFDDPTDDQTYRLVVGEISPPDDAETLRRALASRVGPLEAQLARWIERSPAGWTRGPSEVTVHLRFDAEGGVTTIDTSGAPWRSVLALGLFGLRLPSAHAGLEATVRLQVVGVPRLDEPT